MAHQIRAGRMTTRLEKIGSTSRRRLRNSTASSAGVLSPPARAITRQAPSGHSKISLRSLLWLFHRRGRRSRAGRSSLHLLPSGKTKSDCQPRLTEGSQAVAGCCGLLLTQSSFCIYRFCSLAETRSCFDLRAVASSERQTNGKILQSLSSSMATRRLRYGAPKFFCGKPSSCRDTSP